MASSSQDVENRPAPIILTPDQRLRVFVSSTLQELAEERKAAQAAIRELRLSPVMFELGARSHPPRSLYRAYLEQSHIFVGIYWQRYGWVAPAEEISGLEDEYRLSGNRPKLIYVKTPAPEREDRLKTLLGQIQNDDQVSYKPFSSAKELRELLENDLAVLLTERFAASLLPSTSTPESAPRIEGIQSHLPLPPTPIIGRDREVAEVLQLLLNKDVRLVTLLGPGGIGKSRLGLEVASRLQEQFQDGIYFVPLAQVSDPALVIPAIATVLGVKETPSTPLLESLKAYLQARQTLLLLDNFEQLEEAAPVLSELLAAAPRLELLVTSRSSLRLSAEYVYEVPPLSLPSQGISPFEAISSTEAVQLFVERAKAVKPSFALTKENALAVAEICYRLDGLPLAIELAAARTNLLTPQALLKRLDKRFELLSSGARDLPSRQQTLRNTIDWSYGLLKDEEKKLFARLGVFVGGCTFEAAEAMVGGEGELDVFEGLTALVDQSLVRQREQNDEPRFMMLESLREYALDKLRASGEIAAVQHAHAQYYLALVEQAESHFKGADEALWLERLEEEHDNLRAALEWTEASSQVELGLRLVGALWWFWRIYGYPSEGRERLQRALSQAGATEHPVVHAKALDGAGVLARDQGDYTSARSLHEESLAIARAVGDTRGVASSFSNLGLIAYYQGDYTSARSLFEESLAIARAVGDTRGVASSFSNLGLIATDQGDYTSARSLLEESLGIAQALGDKWGSAICLSQLGLIAIDQGDYTSARSLYEKSVAIRQELGNKIGVAACLASLGQIAIDQGDHASARSLLEESILICQGLGHKMGIAGCLGGFGWIAFHQGDYASARSFHEESLLICQGLGDKMGIAYSLEGFAALRAMEGNAEQAAQLWGAAEALREAIGAPLSSNERSKYERAVEAARNKLDGERFTAALAEGRALTLQQAIAYALEDASG